ncbi:hypothetical protein KI387_044436, partial [Taxus chinensis]
PLSLAVRAMLSSQLSLRPTKPKMLLCSRYHLRYHLSASLQPNLGPRAVVQAVEPLHHPLGTKGSVVAHPVVAPSACVPSPGVSSHTLPASVPLSRMYTGSAATVLGLLRVGDDLYKVSI